VKGSKSASLTYRLKGRSERFYIMLEIELHYRQTSPDTGTIGKNRLSYKGDLKYGFPRSNDDGSISLFARKVEFIHPV